MAETEFLSQWSGSPKCGLRGKEGYSKKTHLVLPEFVTLPFFLLLLLLSSLPPYSQLEDYTSNHGEDHRQDRGFAAQRKLFFS